MKVLIASTPGTGHLNPLLAIGRILIAEGHEVVGLSGSALRARIENIGAGFRPFPAGADFEVKTSSRWSPSEEHSSGAGMAARRDRAPVRRHHPRSDNGCSRFCGTFPADIIIGERLIFGVLPDASRTAVETAPIVLCGTSILHGTVKTSAAFAGLPPATTRLN